MKHDLRFCPVCNTLLLKQDRYRFVLVTRCDKCNKLIHEKCYLNHHLDDHNLIGIVTELEDDQSEFIFDIDSKAQH
ncbi:MAG: hypothetical protein ACFE95_04435 [Candidatus Hodarchaeota archaeon]